MKAAEYKYSGYAFYEDTCTHVLWFKISRPSSVTCTETTDDKSERVRRVYSRGNIAVSQRLEEGSSSSTAYLGKMS